MQTNGWRTLVIRSGEKVTLRSGCVVVAGEGSVEIPVEELSICVIENFQASVTIPLPGIKKLGFRRFQESVYIKVLKNISGAPSVTLQVDEIAPEGSVCLLPLSLDNCMRIVTIRGKYQEISELFNTFIEA